MSLDYMNDLVGRYNDAFNSAYRTNIFSTIAKNSQALGNMCLCVCFFQEAALEFELVKHPSSGLLRVYEKRLGIWVVNSAGEYPYCEGSKAAPTCGGNKWVGERSCSTAQVNMKNLDTLNLLCNQIKNSGTPAQIKPLGNDYKAIWWNRQYYCDSEGRPFVCYANEGQAAINQPRPDTSVTDEEGNPATDNNGTVINNPDNSTNIDLSGMTITLPNGDVQVADAVIYDESTKTYYIDSHDTTNYNITYNYSWTYHINYTSITYIGQTEQYNKYYEVYYELPDGRDSADLTAEDLEQLNFDIDVVNYGRYSDNTSVRALYHFDGDTKDASYWNYKSNFTWNTGASLTYMDAGAFEGALYLDETTHDFIMNLPTALGSGDFWLSFRYYQSATAAPQRDSYLSIGGLKALQFDGRYMYNSSDSQLAEMPIGTWNEISVVRKDSVMFYYLNGVCVGYTSTNAILSSAVQFYFGNKQQTFKYFDEFRVLDVASFYGQNYTCPSVPYDTNLILVLPDERVTPVADEYWAFEDSGSLLKTYNFCQNNISSFVKQRTGESNISYPFESLGSYSASLSGTVINGTGVCLRYYSRHAGNPKFAFIYYQRPNDTEVYTFSIYEHDDGYINSFYDDENKCMAIYFRAFGTTILRVDTCSKNEPSIYKKYTSVTGIEGELPTLKVPSLAVKTDIDVVDQQIGGVRPSVPTKGLVWAMVEGGVIRSIQIYNGQAWEACDGRIFTGTRWVPYGSYNIITMKDFYDVVDASGQDFSYIYSETSFWNWWQKSWNTFTSRLFSALESAGLNTGGTNPDGTSRSLWDTIKDAFNNSLGALISALFDLIAEVLAALLGLVTDMLSFFFGFFTDSVAGAIRSFFTSVSDPALFEFFQRPPVVGPDGSESSGGYGLPDEVGTAFAFISGVIMILPAELRSIMFFAIAAMAFLGVLKLVKS